MADKLATAAASRIAKLLRMILSTDIGDGEWSNAYTLLMAALKEADPGGHEITKRIEAPPTNEEMINEKVRDRAKEIFEKGRATGREEAIKSQQQGMTIVAALANINTGIGGISNREWRAIVAHCYTNRHRIHNSWEADFVESLSGQLASPYSSPSEKQKPIMSRIFQKWFGGKII